jgi:large repetitive protein
MSKICGFPLRVLSALVVSIRSLVTRMLPYYALLIALVSALALTPVAAQAQAAQFSYAIAQLGGGFNSPSGVAVDGSGNIYVADSNNNAVKEIPAGCTSSSCVTTLGGGFNNPNSVAVDGRDNVYVADYGNNAVEVMPAGCANASCVTALGGGFNGPAFVAVDRSGNVYVTDLGNSAVKEIFAGCTATLYSSSGCAIPTLGGGFNAPYGIAVDGSGNIYVSDVSGNDPVDEIPAGCTLASCVKTLGGGFSGPYGLAVDESGNVYVADYNNNAVKEIPVGCTAYSCVITLGGGFSEPYGVAVDQSGSVYVADANSTSVAEVMFGGVNFFSSPVGVASTPVSLAFTFTSGGKIGSPDVRTQASIGLDFSDAGTGTCTTNGANYIYSAGDSCTVSVILTPRFPGSRNGAVRLADSSGNVLATAFVYGTGTAPQMTFFPAQAAFVGVGSGSLATPYQIAFDGAGNIYVANHEQGSSTVSVIPAGGGTPSTLDLSYENDPGGIALDAAGNIYVSDSQNNQIIERASSGTVSILNVNVTPSLSAPLTLQVDGAGNLFILDHGNARVVKVTPAGIASIVSTGSLTLDSPNGLAIDAAGDIYVADSNNCRIVEIAADGTASAVSLPSNVTPLALPLGVAVDGGGNLYITDSGPDTSRVIEVLTTGTASVLQFSGLTVNSTARGIAVDASGNIFVSDGKSNRIDEITAPSVPSLTFAATDLGSTSSDSPQAVTLTNIGNTQLVFESTPTISSGSANFAVDSRTTCSAESPVAAGASCALEVDFQPAAPNVLSGTLTVVDNNLNANTSPYASQGISLSGTGLTTPPTIGGVSPAYGPTVGGTAVTITGTNFTGASAVSFGGTAVSSFTVISATQITAISPTVTSAGAVDVTVTTPGGTSATSAVDQFTYNLTTPTLSFAPIGAQAYGANSSFAVSATSASSGAVTYSIASGPAKLSGSTMTITGAGNIVILASQVASGSYGAATAQTTVTVAKAFLTVTANAATMPYGGPPPTLSGTLTGVVGNDGITASYSTNATATSAAGGTYSVTATLNDPNNRLGNYTVTNTPASFTIAQATQTVSFTIPSSVTYSPSGTVALGATASSRLTVTYSALPASVCTVSGMTLSIVGAGTCTVTASQLGNTNYQAAPSVSQTITVNQATATMTLGNLSQTYTGSPLSATATTTPSGLTVSLTYNGSSTAPTAVGSYAVVGTVNGPNYQGFANGTLVISKATPAVTMPPHATGITYGQTLANSTLSGGTASVAGTFTWTAPATMPGAGTQSAPVTFTPTDTSDYNTPAAVVTLLTVNPAPLSVTVNNATKSYGAADPNLSGRVSGLMNGDSNASVGLVYSTTATANSPIGKYPITAAISSTNYTPSVAPGTLTVTDATLDVTAANATKVYGTANPAFTGNITGEVNGDSFTETFATTATESSPVGSYPITPSVTGADLSNYAVATSNGTLTITQALSGLSLTASAASITPSQGVTLTVTATNSSAGSTGTPTGSVSLFNGSTLLGTAALTNGATSLVLAPETLAPGASYSLTATYSGDTNFTPSSSGAVTVTATALNFTMTSPTSTSLTLVPGGSVSTSFSIAPSYGAYAGTVQFSVTGLPTGATATFSPASMPANTSTTQTVTMTIQLPNTSARNEDRHPGKHAAPLVLGLLLLPFAAMRRVRQSLLRRAAMLILLGVAGFSVTVGLNGCGAQGLNPLDSQTHTMVTVTAKAGSISQEFQLILNVQ